jgi:septum formation topological specificity factor MinE
MQFNEHEPKIEEIKKVGDMCIEQNKQHDAKKSIEHMKKNLNEIIEKAVKVRQDKILFDVDNIFLLEGNLQRTIYQ